MALSEFLLGILRRLWLVALLGGLLAGGAYLYSRSLPRVYAANATLIVGQSLSASQSYNEVLAAQRLAQTYAQLASTRTVVQRVIDHLGLQARVEELQPLIQGRAAVDSLFVTVSARSNDPDEVAAIANQVAAELVSLAPPAPPQTPPAQEAGRMLTIVEQASPPAVAESPRTAINVLVGGGAGVLAALLLIFLAELADNRVRNANRISARTRLPVLGLIPRVSRDGEAAAPRLTAVVVGAARELMTRLEFLALGREVRVYLVSSPETGTGTTTVATGLAEAFAMAGHRTLLVDANVQSPRLHDLFQVPRAPGLKDVLRGSIPADRAIRGTGNENLRVMTAGHEWARTPQAPATPPSRPTRSGITREFVAWARTAAEIVIIDAAPVLSVIDTAHLAELADESLVVCRPDSRLDELAAAIDVLNRVSVTPLGVVLNFTHAARRRLSWSAISDLLTRPLRQRNEVGG
jgi:Mrp family chromosome partitioning ATPase